MGATTFQVRAKAKDAATAFKLLVDEALHEHGHGGYTGTIAEKREFKMVPRKPYVQSTTVIAECFANDNHFCNDKWGPAACVEAPIGTFTFFGTASC